MIGYSLILVGAGVLVWGARIKGFSLGDWLKGRKHRARLFRAKPKYISEEIDLTDLLSGDNFVTDKTFDRCILRYPQVKFQSQCHVNLTSMSSSQWDIKPVGEPISDVILFINCKFTRCLFDQTTFVGTPEDFRQMAQHIDSTSVDEWKKKVWND